MREKNKTNAKRKKDLKVLPKLREKEEQIIEKISSVTENPLYYLDPEEKLSDLNAELEKNKNEDTSRNNQK